MATGSILLVDDEAKILQALASALRAEGHEVVATGSARESQKLLAQRVFDLLIVDNLMPELSGIESSASSPRRRPKPIGRRS